MAKSISDTFNEYLAIGCNIAELSLMNNDSVKSEEVDRKSYKKESPIMKKKMPCVRARKILKRSIIRRLCKPPTKKVKLPNSTAEVVYKNPEFGISSIPCSDSKCSCLLAFKRSRSKASKKSIKRVGPKGKRAKENGAPYKAKSQPQRSPRSAPSGTED